MLGLPKISKKIFPILLVNFIGILGYSIVIPILVFMVQEMGGNAFIYGIMGSVYPAFQLFGAPMLGRLSDRIGRRKVLLISQAGTFLAWCLFIVALLLPITPLLEAESEITGQFMLSVPLLLLFLARAFDGFTGGNVSLANAYLSDISTDEDRKANFGKMGASTSLGFVLGPALAGVLGASALGELLPVLLAALISLIAIFVIDRWLPESVACLVETPKDKRSFRRFFQVEHKDCFDEDRQAGTSLRAVLAQPMVPILYIIYFMTFLAFSFFYAGFPIFASNILGWTPAALGIFLAISSGIMVVVQGPVLSYLSDKVSDELLIVVGSLMVACSFYILPKGTLFWVYTANVLLSVGNGLMWSSFLSKLSQAGTPKIQGAIQGYGNSMGSLASIFGLILGGVLFASVGPQIFWIGSIIFLFIAFFAIFNFRRTLVVQAA